MAQRLDDLFGALANGTRRAVVRLLRDGPVPPDEIAVAIGVSPTELERQLGILCSSGLVEGCPKEARAGRQAYRLCQQPFELLSAWSHEMEAVWHEDLAALADLAKKRAGNQPPGDRP